MQFEQAASHDDARFRAVGGASGAAHVHQPFGHLPIQRRLIAAARRHDPRPLVARPHQDAHIEADIARLA